MTTQYTQLERRVYNTMAELSMDGAAIGVEDIATETGLPLPVVKGAVGSLTKKGKAVCDEPRDVPVGAQPCAWPIHPVHGEGFWCDMMTRDEYEAALL